MPEAHSYLVHSINDDGTILAWSETHLALWRPELGEWDVLGDQLVKLSSLLLSRQADFVLANDESPPNLALRWSAVGGWEVLPGIPLDRFRIEGMSQNQAWLVGSGRNEEDDFSLGWIWNEDSGFETLPIADDIGWFTPVAVANDGMTVVGVTGGIPSSGSQVTPVPVAVRWQMEEGLHRLFDADGEELGFTGWCNRDCSVILGQEKEAHGGDVMGGPPSRAMYTTSSGGFEYLGRFWVRSVSDDAGVVVGVSLHDEPDQPGGVIWTQMTGKTEIIPDLFEMPVTGDDSWDWIEAVSVSANGRKILLRGRVLNDAGPSSTSGGWRAAVLELTPKQTSGE